MKESSVFSMICPRGVCGFEERETLKSKKFQIPAGRHL